MLRSLCVCLVLYFGIFVVDGFKLQQRYLCGVCQDLVAAYSTFGDTHDSDAKACSRLGACHFFNATSLAATAERRGSPCESVCGALPYLQDSSLFGRRRGGAVEALGLRVAKGGD